MFVDRVGKLEAEATARRCISSFSACCAAAIERQVLAPGRGAAARTRSGRGLSGLARHGAQGARRAGRCAPAHPPPRRGHLRRRARREEFRDDLLLHRGHAVARPPAAQRMAVARRRHGDAGGSDGAWARPRQPGLSLHPHPLCRRRCRWRSNMPRCRPIRSSRSMPWAVALRGARRRRARCACCSGCARCCSPPNRPSLLGIAVNSRRAC